MALFTILNGSDQQLSNVNAAGVDVDPFSFKFVDLTTAELAALLNGTQPKEVAVMANNSGTNARIFGIYKDALYHAAEQSS